MSSSSSIVKRSALVGVVLVSTSLGANAYSISRCNALLDGVYRPALLVEVNGEAHVHHMGDDGLTRSIVFNADKALQWAVSRYGGSASWSVMGPCGSKGDWLGLSDGDDSGDDDCGGYLVR